ncbi:hypothetical protein NAI66_10310, partial [Francisella tularensis subsp. holarctica]|nr:hypothetical protein [Francisella tularensis subsp. holarctica]
DVANKLLYQLDLTYLRDSQIVFYSPTKIIVHSNKEILKSKLKDLHDQFVTQLKQNTLFSRLERIDIIIDYTKNNNKTKSSLNYESDNNA